MRIIDAQHHEPSVWLDWEGLDQQQHEKLFLELELASMKAVGVSAAVLHPSSRGWAERAAVAMPDQFKIVVGVPQKRLAGRRASEIEDFVAAERANETVLGFRIVLARASSRWQSPGSVSVPSDEKVVHDLSEGTAFFENGGYDDFLRACESEAMPVFVFAPTRHDIIGKIAAKYPRLQLIVDHLGLSQPPVADPDDPPFRYLPKLLELSEFGNVAVKLCNLPAFSAAGYPFVDLREQLTTVVQSFGADRLLWASDISRIAGRLGADRRNPYGEADYPGKHNYSESLHFILDNDALSSEQKEWILGRTVEKILGW